MCAMGRVKLSCFDESVKKGPMGSERLDFRLSASEVVSMLQPVAVLAGYLYGVDLGLSI